jgi:hypothetical protein
LERANSEGGGMRRRVLLICTSLVLIPLVVVSCTTGISQEEYDTVCRDLERTQQELETTQQTLSETQTELQAASDQLSQTQAQLADVRSQVEELQDELDLYKELGISVRSGKQPPHNQIINNRNAVNPTWQQLTSFIFTDRTDEKPYIEDVFMCGEFAEQVHNNAESAGIRAAYVRIKYEGDEIPHALNAFVTSDRGLVYIDCTGCEKSTCDRVAYVEAGKEHVAISLGENTPLDYESCERAVEAWDSYNERVEAHNREVEQYNLEVEGKVYYIGTPAWERITEWKNRLDMQVDALYLEREQLETIYKPMGIVSSIEIYW